MWIAAMRKRLNTYASRMRAPREEGDEGVQGNAQEDEEEVREESGEEEEVQEGRDETEGDESVRMDEMEEEGMNDGRMRGGSDMQGLFNYLNDDQFDN